MISMLRAPSVPIVSQTGFARSINESRPLTDPRELVSCVRLAGTQMQFDQLKRREFIAVLGGAAAWPIAASAQQTIQKVGFLYPGPSAAAKTRISPFLEGLRTTGFRVPQEIELISQAADGDPARLSPLAAELIDRKVDVIAA